MLLHFSETSKKCGRPTLPQLFYLTRRLNVLGLIQSEELRNAPHLRASPLRTRAVVQDTTGPWKWYAAINYSLLRPPLFISITSQRDPWKPVALSTACGGPRLFHSKHPPLTRQTWHVRLIMRLGEWPTRTACLPITPLATSQGLQIRSSPFTWERWSQIAALGPSLLSDVSAHCSDAKKKATLPESAGGRESDVGFVGGSGAKSCNT